MTPGPDDGRGEPDPPVDDAETPRPDGRSPRDAGSDQSLAEYEWDADDQPSTVLLRAVAAERDQAPQNLPTLFERVDGDALDALLETARSDGADHVRVTLSYAGFRISVGADGHLRLQPYDEP